MKTIVKRSLKQLIADRYLLTLLLSMILISTIASIIIGFSVHPSELQLVSHYSEFGITHLYRDQWFYLLVFVFFGLIVAILHSIISIKLLLVKGRSLAIAFAWLSVGIILLGLITALAVINVWTPLL